MSKSNGGNTLIVAGVGIKSISHLTEEVKKAVSDSDLVMFLLNEPLMKQYIRENSKSYYDLEDTYYSHDIRFEAYDAISNKILSAIDEYHSVCVVAYGHPFFCADPFLKAAKIADKASNRVIFMPGISSLDCLISDLMIDPARGGLQIYEATHLLHKKKPVDISVNLIVLQAGFVSVKGHVHLGENDGYKDLCSYLQKLYPIDHKVTIYEASLYPSVAPKIEVASIASLHKSNVSPISSIFVPSVVS